MKDGEELFFVDELGPLARQKVWRQGVCQERRELCRAADSEPKRLYHFGGGIERDSKPDDLVLRAVEGYKRNDRFD